MEMIKLLLKKQAVDCYCQMHRQHLLSTFPTKSFSIHLKTAKKRPLQPTNTLHHPKSSLFCITRQQPIPKQQQNQAKRYQIILFMHQHCQAHIMPVLERKLSDSPLTDHSDPPTTRSTIVLPLCLDLRLHLFSGNDAGLSERMTRRGVSWLQTVGWSRGMSEACIWNAVLLFYAYRSKFPLRKEEMQAIILVCLQLSSKIYQTRHLLTSDLLMLASRPILRDDLRAHQEKILMMLEFNIVVPHYLTSFYDLLDSETANKAFFLCELLSLKDHSIYFEKEKIERIIRMVQDSNWSQLEQQQGEQIRQLLNGKESRILHHKYGNRFDVDLFVELLKAY